MSLQDFPLVAGRPGPTDAELAAERDVKHAAAVQEWNRRNQEDDEWPTGEVTG